jgi:hypothetical protein
VVAVLAAVGLEPLWRWVRKERAFPRSLIRPAATFFLAQVLFGSTVFLYLVAIQDVRAAQGLISNDGMMDAVQVSPGGGGTFQPASLKRAAVWLSTVMGPEDVILAQTHTGNYLAGMVPGRVFVGHWVGTLNFGEKEEAARRFYLEQDDAVRVDFLVENRIGYVVYGPYERAVNGAAPLDGRHLRPAYSDGDVTIYRVELATENGSRAEL